MSDHDARAVSDDLVAASRAFARLSREPELFRYALGAFRQSDAAGFAEVLERAGIHESCRLVCDWFCSKECVIRCLRLAGPAKAGDIPDVREFADVTARIAADEDALRRLVEIVEAGDQDAYRAVLEELDALRFRHLLCFWICSVRCHLVCRVLCERERDDEVPDLVSELLRAGEAIRKLASEPEALRRAVEAVRSGDCEGLQKIVTSLDLARHCIQICLWFCAWRCVLVCVTLCRQFLHEQPDLSDDEIYEFAQVTAKLGDQPEVLIKLADAVIRGDEKTFAAIVAELGLERYCVQLCHWICHLYCRRFCICVCPPLVARIDDPATGACASATAVPGCSTSAGPLVGIEIEGTAAGAGFDHYTLRYSWGANPPVDTAVVYPDCSRPPAATGFGTPVIGGTLGWLDVTLLPPGITAFTVYLDVFDSGSGSASDTTTFEIKTEAVEITAVAKVGALDAPDPFHPGSTIRLIKDTNDPSLLVPETAVGGSFTIDGSAYVIGCDRIMSQFVLARFDAPPAAPAPSPADALGGTNIISPVPYEDTVDHPWQSGCFPVVTPNTILNGNLVAYWGENNCTLGGITYKVPKVKGTNWASSPLNGRYVVLLEARDRLLPGGTFPGSVAAVERVVVWIDNHEPTALISSVGGIAGCGDILLSNYQSAPAAIRGVAWDPPIVPSAPQQAPNDNFGSYALSYKKNGEVGSFGIPAATPNTRVPNLWPGPVPPGADGLLADWDIVTALDYTGPAPTPPGKLARGERCAFLISLSVVDTTHVGDSGNHHDAHFPYAVTIINDL